MNKMLVVALMFCVFAMASCNPMREVHQRFCAMDEDKKMFATRCIYVSYPPEAKQLLGECISSLSEDERKHVLHEIAVHDTCHPTDREQNDVLRAAQECLAERQERRLQIFREYTQREGADYFPSKWRSCLDQADNN